MKVKMMMSLRVSLTVPLLFLIFISGAVAQDWSVNYYHKSICVLKGSTVNMVCTYTPPQGHKFKKAFWSKDSSVDAEPPDLLVDPEYRDRVKSLIDEYGDCSFKLRDVTEKDQRKYYFRFLTDQPGERYQGQDGVDLSVTDLQLEVPERVIEGGKVTLTCKTTCRLTVTPTFTWYRNGTPLSSRTDQLHLQSVSREDAGRYRCAVEGQKLHSPEVTLNVRYGPKSISVSISPSGEIVEGSSVTLTCSSDGNPPVEYTWFKGTSLVATGETFTMKKISSVNSGGYKCRSSNEHGEKYSDTVTLNVLYPPKSVSVSISLSGEIVEGSSVTLTCSSDGNPPVQKYTWFKKVDNEVLQKWTNQIYSITNISSTDSGEYQCIATNTQGSQSSEYKSLTVLYAPKKVWVSISETAWNSSVTLTCSSDGYPPVQNYTWFKEGGSSPVGSGHSYSAVQSGSYYCEACNEYGCEKSASVWVNQKGAVAQDWSVNYNHNSICALKGSAVIMDCFYTYPSNHSVQKAFWSKELVTGVEHPDLLEDPEYRGRVQYLGDEYGDCSLRLRDVTERDQRKYYFTFLTDRPGGKYLGKDGVALSVTDLQLEVPERVIEGDKVTLTCKTTCSLTVRPTFTWYRNGTPLSSRTDQLHLQLVSTEDAGRYRCAVEGQELHSPEVTLNVRYGPKSVSVSISPSGEIVEGSLVTLTCSSDANPPVQNYTWFKEGGGSPVGSGYSYSAVQSGSYYCEACNEYGSQTAAPVWVNPKGRKK